MLHRPVSFLRGIRPGRFFLLAAGCACLFLLVLASLLYVSPQILSDSRVQRYLQQSLSKKMDRTVAWSRLSFGWREGISFSGLVLGEGPAPLLSCSVGEGAIVPSLGTGEGGRFVGLALRVREVKLAMAPGPPKPSPPRATKDPLTALAEGAQRLEGMKWPLPLDVRLQVDVAPVRVSYRAPAGEMLLEDLSLALDVPSLARKPLKGEVAGSLSVSGKRIRTVRLALQVDSLVKENSIRPALARLAADASLPGVAFAARGGLGDPDGLRVRGDLELSPFLAAAAPFLPPNAPAAAGKVSADLHGKLDRERNLRGALEVAAEGLSVRGGALKRGVLGPLSLRLRQEIASDRKKQRVDFSGGSLQLPGTLVAAWSAAVDNPSGAAKKVLGEVGPVRVDLDRLLELARPLLPEKLPLRELQGELTLKRASFSLEGKGGRGEAAIESLALRLPRVRGVLAKGAFEADGVEVALERASAPLAALRPGRLQAACGWSMGRLSLSGKQPLSLQEARGRGDLSLTDLELKSGSPRKIACGAELKQSLELAGFSAGEALRLKNLRQSLQLLARIHPSGDIDASLPLLQLAAAEVRTSPGGKKVAPFPLNASLTSAGIHLPQGGKPTLQQAKLELGAGDFLQLTTSAGVTPAHASAEGVLKGELGRLVAVSSPFLPAGFSAAGAVRADWRFAAPLPPARPVQEKNPLRAARGGLAMLEQGELSLQLENVALRLPSTGGEPLQLSGLHTRRPLRLTMARRGESVRGEGEVSFSGVSGIKGGKVPAQHGALSLEAELASWRALRLHQELRLQPLGVNQIAEMTVDRIEPLLEEGGKLTPALLLKRLDATLFAHLDASGSGSRSLPGGVDLSGEAAAGLRVDLTAGREVRVRGYTETRDFGVRLANGSSVEGMRSDLVLDRTYRLAGAAAEPWVPLSAGLVRPSAAVVLPAGAQELARRVRDDLRGEVNGPRRITIRRIMAKGKVPLEISALEGDVQFDTAAMGLSFLQAEALGGTLRASGVIDLRPEVPRVAAACSFSALDMALLLPEERRRLGGKSRDSEITGDMTLEGPLASGQRELLEGMRLKMNIHRIGANTLERALYSLDPYERNERLVAQRKLLHRGGLKWARASAVDGSFSMEGEALVGGIAVELPRVERLRLSELPLKRETESLAAAMARLRPLLELLRADTLAVGSDGRLSVQRSAHGN